jgi:hypothetical protein
MPDVVIAELVAERPDLDNGPDVAPMSLAPCARSRLTAGGVEALDGLLNPAGSRPVTLTETATLLNATPDLAQVVSVDDGHLLYAGPGGRRAASALPDWKRPLPLAGSATFLGAGRLLVTTPDSETREHAGRSYEQKTTHRVLLVGSDTGVTLDEITLDVFAAGTIATAHPVDGSVLLDLGEGQDGSSLYRIRATDDRLTADRILENTVSAGFSPDGTRLLLLPHPSFDELPQVVSWPDLEVLSIADLDTAGIDPGGIDFYGCFMDDDRILLTTREQGLWLADGILGTLAPIELPDLVTHGSLDFSLTMGLSTDTFSTRIWRDDQDLTTVWRLR